MTTNVDEGGTNSPLWSLAGGTVIGPPAKKRGKPNQDHLGYIHAHNQYNQPYLITAVSDGAGSLELSHIGAEIAVHEVLETAAEYLQNNEDSNVDDIADAAGEAARQALKDHPDSSQLGSTLAAAVIGVNDYAVTITGDAFAVIAYDDGAYELLQNPKAGEYANITKLLTSNNTDTTVYSDSLDGVTGIAVSSDGLAHTTIDNSTGTPTVGFWDTIFSRAHDGNLDVQAIFEYMRSLDKIDDDTTLIVATRD